MKACPGRGQVLSGPLALSYLESGHTVPFSPQDFYICVYLSIAATTQDPAGRDLHHYPPLFSFPSPPRHFLIFKTPTP